ncbi:MAG: hypothetical protein M1832_005838 [Thelocarpon impressellum]|nr:MAG: hypothetical protein M1832_005838 [Thelocarpon impressellum]
MFRSRFSDAFPKSLSHYGPQDIEKGVVDSVPGEPVENLLCALLALVLNRKKPVERGHHQRALEEAVQSHTSQWPRGWSGKNPLHGGNTFATMAPTERLTLLKTLVLWAMCSSDAVQAILKDSYKQVRHDDDLNQPLSVQPWGLDGDKRRFWLIEGQDDTNFRLYRESNIKLKHNTWWSVAGTIDELKSVGQHLGEEGSQAARRLSERITLAIPRFEATEEKRRRREYRLARKAQFTKPEPGFSMYEGRTRGKKIRYTYSSDEDGESESTYARRSGRQSGISTPAEAHDILTFTASGRQVRSRHGGTYGETMLSGQTSERATPGVIGQEEFEAAGEEAAGEEVEGAEATAQSGRPRRSRLRQELNGRSSGGGGEHIPGYNSLDEMDDEEDAASSGADDYAGEEDDEADVNDDDADEDEDITGDEDEDEKGDGRGSRDRSLVVQLRYQKKDGEEDVKDTAAAPAPLSNGTSTNHQPPAQPAERMDLDLDKTALPLSDAAPYAQQTPPITASAAAPPPASG